MGEQLRADGLHNPEVMANYEGPQLLAREQVEAVGWASEVGALGRNQLDGTIAHGHITLIVTNRHELITEFP